MVGTDKGNLGSKVFFIWGALCTACFVYAYLLVWETKGLTLEQVDRMMEETTPRHSASWKPHATYATDMGVTKDGKLPVVQREAQQPFEKAHLTSGTNAVHTEGQSIA